MMRTILFFFLISFISCRNYDALPPGIMNRDKMQLVLYDVIRADELVNYQAYGDSATIKKNFRNVDLYEEIFRIHGINRATFQKSMKFYELRPDLLQPILDSLKNLSEKKMVKPDSIKFSKPDSIKSSKPDSIKHVRPDSIN
jgi:hypothetical protein